MKITVYIPIHNYGKYIKKSIDSVLKQTTADWELIIINDGSTDNTSGILQGYLNHPKIRIVEQVNRGLSISNNIALRLSNAKYFMRLDADDYLDENALIVMSNILDTKPKVGLVYPDYYVIDEKDEILEAVRRKKIGKEARLLDLPAHGACTMFRKECLLELGGYAEEFDCQDGYGLWLKFLQSFKPYNVNIPLFYYRQHSSNLTGNYAKILETRRKIKRNFVKDFKGNRFPKILAVIPVIKKPSAFSDSAFNMLAGKPLIWYTLSEVIKTNMLDKIVLSSDDEAVLDYAASFKGVMPLKRPKDLTRNSTEHSEIVDNILESIRKKENYRPDAVLFLYINTPLRRVTHIEKAIDTMAIFNVDSVISIEEELSFCYTHNKQGLIPIQKSRELRLEKDAVYKENGAILLSKLESITATSFFGKKIGHIIMLPEDSVRIKSPYNMWLAEQIINGWLTNGKNK